MRREGLSAHSQDFTAFSAYTTYRHNSTATGMHIAKIRKKAALLDRLAQRLPSPPSTKPVYQASHYPAYHCAYWCKGAVA